MKDDLRRDSWTESWSVIATLALVLKIKAELTLVLFMKRSHQIGKQRKGIRARRS